MHSNESACRKSGRLGLEQVRYFIPDIVHSIWYVTPNEVNKTSIISPRTFIKGDVPVFKSNFYF